MLSIGPGLGRQPSPPVSDPSDVRAVSAGYGATGAQVVVDRTAVRPPVPQAAEDGGAEDRRAADSETEGAHRAKDEQQEG